MVKNVKVLSKEKWKIGVIVYKMKKIIICN
jgi:hypothetical protein